MRGGEWSGSTRERRAVQRRAGVEAEAARLTGMLAPPDLRGGLGQFLIGRTYAAMTARDAGGRLWVSPLVGDPRFLAVAGPAALEIATTPGPGDPLHGLPAAQPIGLLVIDMLPGGAPGSTGRWSPSTPAVCASRWPRRTATARNTSRRAPWYRPRPRRRPGARPGPRWMCGPPTCRVRRHVRARHQPPRARQRRLPSRRSGGLRQRRRRRNSRHLAGLPGQPDVQQPRKPRGRSRRCAVVRRLDGGHDAAPVGDCRRRLGVTR